MIEIECEVKWGVLHGVMAVEAHKQLWGRNWFPACECKCVDLSIVMSIVASIATQSIFRGSKVIGHTGDKKNSQLSAASR